MPDAVVSKTSSETLNIFTYGKHSIHHFCLCDSSAYGQYLNLMLQTEFEFTLPKGYLDDEDNLHRQGVMRLSRAMDEIVPLRDPRVKSNPAYATVMILSRVIVKLGALDEVTPRIVENFFTCDLDYLQKFYRQINDLAISPDLMPETEAPLPPASE